MCGTAGNAVLGRGRDGFTLVEVLIVVAILALVAAGLVGLGSYMQTQNNTVLTEQCLQLLSTAVAEFHDITGHYPVDNWGDIGADGSRLAGAEDTNGPPSSDELLYLQLSLLPQTREIIANLPEKLLVRPLSGARVQLAGQSSNTPYLRSIVDAWEQPVNYVVYEDDPDVPNGPNDDPNDPDDVFPRLYSNGPNEVDDGETGDDISR